MQIRILILVTALVAVGCRQVAEPPDNAPEAARGQAELSTDAEQQKLWNELAERGGAEGLEGAVFERDAVRQRQVVAVPDRPAARTRQPFPETVETALAVLALPAMEEEELSAEATVAAVEGQFLTLDLGELGSLELMAKVGGRTLQAAVGDTARVRLRRGDPFARNDLLAVELGKQAVFHALVGGRQPVQISAPRLLLNAAQTGEPENNTMPVAVQVSRANARMLKAGEETEVAGLNVKVLASVAVQGESANVLPEPYRLEILAWRGR